MSWISDDITFCMTDDCPRKDCCYRAKKHKPGDVYSASDFTNECAKEDYDYYLPYEPGYCPWQE